MLHELPICATYPNGYANKSNNSIRARFVASNIGGQFADPPPFDLNAVFKASNCRTPLIFILSPGVDPTNQTIMLAEAQGIPFDNVAMGQGQGQSVI